MRPEKVFFCRKVERHDLSKRTGHLYHVLVLFFYKSWIFGRWQNFAHFQKLEVCFKNVLSEVEIEDIFQAKWDLKNVFFSQKVERHDLSKRTGHFYWVLSRIHWIVEIFAGEEKLLIFKIFWKCLKLYFHSCKKCYSLKLNDSSKKLLLVQKLNVTTSRSAQSTFTAFSPTKTCIFETTQFVHFIADNMRKNDIFDVISPFLLFLCVNERSFAYFAKKTQKSCV